MWTIDGARIPSGDRPTDSVGILGRGGSIGGADRRLTGQDSLDEQHLCVRVRAALHLTFLPSRRPPFRGARKVTTDRPSFLALPAAVT